MPETSITYVTSNKNGISLSWNYVLDAVKYEVYRSTQQDSNYELIKTTTSTYYLDTNPVSGVTNYYKVKCLPTKQVYASVTSKENHYLQKPEKIEACKASWRALKPGGIYISFENTAPLTSEGKEATLKRWEEFQLNHGKELVEVDTHLKRYGTVYFPITVIEQVDILRKCGFWTVEILWYSYLQAGVYGIK